MVLLIVLGLIVEQFSFHNSMVIGEILVWAGIITTIIPLLIFVLFGGLAAWVVGR